MFKQQAPDKIIELILCANVIPHERKIFLENVGIECRELGPSLIQTVANKHNYLFLDRQKKGITKETQQMLREDARIWIFQANPNRYDIFNALSDPELDKQSWQVKRYKNEIQRGDIALIWMSGSRKEAGIYAIAEIVSDPLIMADFPAEEKYWVNEEDEGKKKRLKVIVSIKQNLVNNPVLRDELKNIKELKNLSILKKCPRGTNFKVEKAEWHVIKKIMEEKIL